MPIEMKSGQTITSDFFKGLTRWRTLAGETALHPSLIYGGTGSQQRHGIRVNGWRALSDIEW